MSDYLAQGVSVSSKIHPVESGGAVFEFYLNDSSDESEAFQRVRKSVGQVLGEIPQRMFAGDPSHIKFGGTNLYLEGNRIVVIKGDDEPASWQGDGIRNDVARVVSSAQGSKKS